MALQEQSDQTDKLSSFVARAKSLSRELSWRKLMAWFTVVAAASVALECLLPSGAKIPGPMIFAGMVILGGCAGLLSSLYCLAVFILSRQTNYLFYAVAFAAFGSGVVYQSVADSQSLRSSQPFILTLACLIASSLFFAAAYANYQPKSSQKSPRFIRAAIATLWVVAFPIAAFPYVLDSRLLLTLTRTPSIASAWHVFEYAADIIATIFAVVALFGNYRTFQQSRDRIAILVCYVLVPFAFGLIFKLASSFYFDMNWTISQFMWACAWLVFFVGGAIENAFAHREAEDRLSELEAMHEISWSLVGAGSFTELIDRFATTLKLKLNTTAAAVYLSENNGEVLEVVAATDPENYIKVGSKHNVISTNRFPGFHTGHTARAFTSGEIQVVNDVFIDVEFLPWRTVARDNGCAVSLPLVHHGNTIGVVNLYFAEIRQFTPQRLNLLKTIAVSATPAIETMCKHENIYQTDAVDKAA